MKKVKVEKKRKGMVKTKKIKKQYLYKVIDSYEELNELTFKIALERLNSFYISSLNVKR